MIQTRSCSSIT